MNLNIGAGSNNESGLCLNSGGTGGIALTPSATPHTKGTIIEMVSALPFDVFGFELQFYNNANGSNRSDWGVNLYLGAAASEVEVHPDILLSGGAGPVSTFAPSVNVHVPLFLPRGERLSASVQCNLATQPAVGLVLKLHGESLAGQPVFNKATAYGYDAANTRGVLSNSGAVTNTLGPIVQLDAAIASAMKAAMLCIGTGSATSVVTTSRGLADVMIGAAASEQILFGQTLFGTNGGFWLPPANYLGYCDVAAGTRLSVRHQAQSTTATQSVRETRFYVIGYS